jgi:hypothetical protein
MTEKFAHKKNVCNKFGSRMVQADIGKQHTIVGFDIRIPQCSVHCLSRHNDTQQNKANKLKPAAFCGTLPVHLADIY